MNSDEYQITIKSANQKVDDYVTSCKSAWTVQRLKQHISETHVNQPKVEDQRLIYAGNLLKDTLTLKQIFFRDSLCTELTNSSKTDFTIHLVCSQNSILSGNSSLSQRNIQQHANYSTIPSNSQNDGSRMSSAPPSSDTNTTLPDSRSNPRSYNHTNSSTSSPASNRNLTYELERLMQSDQMRQQFAIFQQLVDLVAAQIVINLNETPRSNSTDSSSQTNEGNQSESQVELDSSDIGTLSDILPQVSHQLRVDDELAATVAASTIAGLRLAENGTVLQSTSQSIYSGQAGSSLIPNQNLDGTHVAGVSIAEGRDAIGSASNDRGLNNEDRNVARGPQQMVAGNANHGRLNIDVRAEVQQAQPIVEQPIGVAAAQVGDQEAHGMQHDVIDWVYYSIRAMIFVTAIYINASLFRLSFLAGILALCYYINRRSVRRAALQNQQPGARPDEARRAGDMVQEEQNARQRAQEDAIAAGVNNAEQGNGMQLRHRLNAGHSGRQEGQVNDAASDNAEGNERTTELTHDRGAQRRVPFLKLCYLVVTDFLASLVPE